MLLIDADNGLTKPADLSVEGTKDDANKDGNAASVRKPKIAVAKAGADDDGMPNRSLIRRAERGLPKKRKKELISVSLRFYQSKYKGACKETMILCVFFVYERKLGFDSEKRVAMTKQDLSVLFLCLLCQRSQRHRQKFPSLPKKGRTKKDRVFLWISDEGRGTDGTPAPKPLFSKNCEI